MLIKNRWASNILSKTAIQRFLNGSNEYQLDVVIDIFADQYINFYVGWDYYKNDINIDAIYITYEQLIDDELALVKLVSDALSIDVSKEKIRNISSKIEGQGGINFSTGIIGRGVQMMSDSQISKLKEKAYILGCDDESFLGFKL